MKSQKLIIVLTIILILSLNVSAINVNRITAHELTTVSEVYIPSENFSNSTSFVAQSRDRIISDDLNVLDRKLNECLLQKEHAHDMAESARALGYDESHPVILLAKDEWENAHDNYLFYKNQYDTLYEQLWGQKMEEYPVATTIWRYMKDLGWNDYVCAGILGNMMAEAGGQTLNITPIIYGDGFYGICQWSRGYADVWDADLEKQLDFLRDSIRYELNTYGYAFKKGFDFESFLLLEDEQDAALAFAKCYERCASFSYSVREKNATKAYQYFTEK